ncbi:uncharacterized protein LOC132211003 [Stegostoma tigrinum]|uniref:uncharacterized protein LOC132211003 n=1 Tax=Stegostoma tigrinum TaxID=3053191 RepID=UPI00287011FC|nr:uncharacterized protein LOC132211003 [Stegostoma tigrinum]
MLPDPAGFLQQFLLLFRFPLSAVLCFTFFLFSVQEEAVGPQCHFIMTETMATDDNWLQEEEHLYRVFKRNGYPKSRIGCYLRDRSKQEDTTRPDSLFTLQYIKDISEMTTRLLRSLGIRVAHKPTTTLRLLLTNIKDPIPKTGVIYEIPCKDCEKHYIGQTGRKLTTLIHKHQLATKRHDQFSLVWLNMDKEGHEFDLDNTSIIAKPNRDRKFLELGILIRTPSTTTLN